MERSVFTQLLFWGALLALLGGAVAFVRYNHIENTPGQARLLKLSGLREMVCQGKTYQPQETDHCGGRAIYGDADWGITAYIDIYGITDLREAERIADFIVQARRRDGQTFIPISLDVYQLPRSEANRRSNKKKLHRNINREKLK